jgi:hypothetical protein
LTGTVWIPNETISSENNPQNYPANSPLIKVGEIKKHLRIAKRNGQKIDRASKRRSYQSHFQKLPLITNITTTNLSIREFKIPVTNGFEWRMLANFSVALSANQNHLLQIHQRKDGTKIKRDVITSDNSFNGSNASDYIVVTLTFDIGEPIRGCAV